MEASEGTERSDRSAWTRLRSGVLLGGLLIGIGVAAAAVIGIVAVAVAALMDQALG